MDGGARAKGALASYPLRCRRHRKGLRRKGAAFEPPSIDHARFEPDRTDLVPYADSLNHAVATPLANPPGCRNVTARICELFEGVVAFFDARGGRRGL